MTNKRGLEEELTVKMLTGVFTSKLLDWIGVGQYCGGN